MTVKKDLKGLFIKLAIGVCVVVMIVSGVFIVKNMLEDKKGIETYDSLEQFLAPPPEPMETVTPESIESETPPTEEPANDEDIEPTVPEDMEDTEEPEETPKTEASPKAPAYVNKPAPDYWPVVDFEGLREVNSEIAAWIISPGTNINYPVVRGSNNNYYLNHLFTGEKSKAGSIFMDYRNRLDFTHRNTVIYGHHMKNRTMFWSLTQYRSQSYYNSHPAIRLVTPGGNYELHIVATYVASVNDNAWQIGFETDEAFLEWIDEARAKSDVASSATVSENDRVVTLSTCTYEFSNARYIVLAKLVSV